MGTSGGAGAADATPGALEESALWKAVVICAVNEFKGQVAVTHAGGKGAIYLDGGRVVHAEAGALRGEPAFRAIMRWPGSEYALQPEVEAGQRTISRGVALLLLDLKGPAPVPSPPPAPAPARPPRVGAAGSLERLAAATERIRLLPGVLGATFTRQEGPADRTALAPLDAAAVAIGGPARRLGAALGLDRLVLGVARGTERLVLLIAARDHQITVVVRADDQVEAVQAQIRGLLRSEL